MRHRSMIEGQRVRREIVSVEPVEREPKRCWLCARPLGRRVQWHHLRPKSRGGRETAAVHPICHETIHATFTNEVLARIQSGGTHISESADMARFLAWIADKPPDFHAPTRSRR